MWLGAHTVTRTHTESVVGSRLLFHWVWNSINSRKESQFQASTTRTLVCVSVPPVFGLDGGCRHQTLTERVCVCVCVAGMCVLFLLTYTISSPHHPHSFCIGSTCCAFYTVKLFKCKISAADNFDRATMDDVRAKPKGKPKGLGCLLVVNCIMGYELLPLNDHKERLKGNITARLQNLALTNLYLC